MKEFRGSPFGRLNRNVGSRFIKRTASINYAPKPKAPSRRDRHRAEVAARKAA